VAAEDFAIERAGLIGPHPPIMLPEQVLRDGVEVDLDTLQNIGGPIDSFWLNNHLKITSDEQLGLMKKLYFDQLPFFQHTQSVVRQTMLTEKNANYQLVYKAAGGIGGNGHGIGWIMGWIEENKHPYFFVLNLESTGPNLDMPNTGLPVLRSMLGQLGFFQGKK